MSVPEQGVPVAAWLARRPGWMERVEVVGGQFVVRRVGGNPHAQIARRLANAFESQWGVEAAAPGRWVLTAAADGSVLCGREPDVLVNGPALNHEPVFRGVPEAAVEVWSPTNTLAEMNAKRHEYHAAGLPVFVEAYLTSDGDVHLEWLVADLSHPGRWTPHAAAAGEVPLRVTGPRPFEVIPNALLHRTG